MPTTKTIGIFIIVFMVFYGLFSSYFVSHFNKTSGQVSRERWFWSIVFALATVLIMP